MAAGAIRGPSPASSSAGAAAPPVALSNFRPGEQPLPGHGLHGRPFAGGLRKPFDVGTPLEIHVKSLASVLRRRSPPPPRALLRMTKRAERSIDVIGAAGCPRRTRGRRPGRAGDFISRASKPATRRLFTVDSRHGHAGYCEDGRVSEKHADGATPRAACARSQRRGGISCVSERAWSKTPR